MRTILRRPGEAILALLLVATGPLGAAPQAPPPAPPPPAVAAPPAPPPPPALDESDGDIDPHEGDLDIEVRDRAPDAIAIVRGPRSYVGLRLLDLTPELRELYTGSKDAGVLVSSVEADTPAAKAGIRVGDVVVKVGGESVSSAREIARAIRHKEPGQTATIEVRRDRAVKTFEVAVAGRTGSRREILIPDLYGPAFALRTEEWTERISERVERMLERMQQKLRKIDERLRELERRWQTK
jgi:membrane-associated protease RseP (regulator of RpoE activity)